MKIFKPAKVDLPKIMMDSKNQEQVGKDKVEPDHTENATMDNPTPRISQDLTPLANPIFDKYDHWNHPN